MRLPLLPLAVGLVLTSACAPHRPPLEPDPPASDVVVLPTAEDKRAGDGDAVQTAAAVATPANANAKAKAKAKRAVKPPSAWKLNGKSVSTALEHDALYALDEVDAKLHVKWARSGGVHLCAYEGAEYTLTRGAARYRLSYWQPTTPDSLEPCDGDEPKPKDVKVGPSAIRIYDEDADVLLVVEPLNGGTKAEAKKLFEAVFKK